MEDNNKKKRFERYDRIGSSNPKEIDKSTHLKTHFRRPIFDRNNNNDQTSSLNDKNPSRNYNQNSLNPSISLRKVNELLTKNPEDIVLQLCNPHFGYENYLNENNLGSDLITQFILLIEKSFTCNSLKTKLNQIVELFSKSKFLHRHVYEIIERKRLVSQSYVYNINLIRSVLNTCCFILETNNFSKLEISPILDKLKLMIKYEKIDEELLKIYENKLEKLIEKCEKKIEQNRNKTFKNIDLDYLEPPEDFTELSIIPNLRDILSNQEPFLRKNISNGSYQNVHHYLDVQFRLLREDFLQPLREGIIKLRTIIVEETKNGNDKNLDKNKNILRKINNIDSLNVYFNVIMDSCILSDNGIVYSVKLNLDKKCKINWENSKRLIYGSLVCLSGDFFSDNCLVGIVCARDSEKLKNEGIIVIKFNYDVLNNDIKNLPDFSKTYTMLETSSYFESYKHVLEALKSFEKKGEEDFPFRENLVYSQNQNIDRPKYLINQKADFRCLIIDCKELKKKGYGRVADWIYPTEVKYAESCFTSNPSSWPNQQQMNMDMSQYDAIKLALENKLALIQGPPGTGKTWLGVKLVQFLIHNQDLWWNRKNERKRPILMICYTNHALDQFLENCIRECKLDRGVVRIGGRCKNPNLNQYLLSNLRGSYKNYVSYERSLYHRMSETKKNLTEIKNSIEKINQLKYILNESSCQVLLSFGELSKVIEYDQLNEFEILNRNNDKLDGVNQVSSLDYTLLEWLGVFDIRKNFNTFETDLSGLFFQDNQNKKEPNQENEVDHRENHDDENNVDDDDLENEERMLENENEFKDDVYKRLEEKKKKIPSICQKQYLNQELISNMYNSYDLSKLEEDDEYQGFQTKARLNKSYNTRKVLFVDNYLNQIFSFKAKTSNDFSLCNILGLDMVTRFQLYNHWVEKYKTKMEQDLLTLNDEFNYNSTSLQELKMQEDKSILEDAYIIAMTTTGSARYHSILNDVGPRIVIVEEAAEVFEAHIVSSLSKHCEHLILIGDHVQLRPNPSVYKLATTYKLNVSLFERLINNKIKSVMLTTQHRMRPEISVLMKHFYNQTIHDHESVKAYPNVIGLKKNVFFINHNRLESDFNEISSKKNEFESKFLTKFCQYLIKQKYLPTQITIITMYLGQLIDIRNNLRNHGIKNVKVSTVDNYQGEENDIILLSLVRSNQLDKIGFLKINNRVCVALSRAKIGFYCIGNFDLMSKNSQKWSDIIKTVEQNDNFGDFLTLSCGLHEKNDINVYEPSDFDLRPDGGCNLKCNFRLICGHVCHLHCHTYDLEHKDYKCLKKCDKIISKCGHYCAKLCSHEFECNECSIKVDKVINECGHKISFRCDTEPERSDCREPCSNILSCGHQCTIYCSDLICEPCETLINVNSVCSHKEKLRVLCSEPEWKFMEKCKKRCNEVLGCSHVCLSTCGNCLGGRLHDNCREKCDRILFCGHKCQEPCSEQCQPCKLKCENSCQHSQCNFLCSDPCSPCMEKCAWKCKHLKCTKLCNELCDREPCNKPCSRKLICGHKCVGFCGETCPYLCRKCNREELTEIFFGNEDNPKARFVFLEDCGHVIESNAMDEWVYKRFDSKLIQLPECPKCKTPIRRNLRYSNYIKRQLKSIEDIKIKSFGSQKKIEEEKKKLLKDLREHFDHAKWYQNTISKIGDKFIPINELLCIKNTINLIKKLQKVNNLIRSNSINQTYLDWLSYQQNKMKYYLKDSKTNTLKLNRQEKLDNINKEIDRIEYLLNYFIIKNKFETNSTSFDTQNKEKIENLLNNLDNLIIKSIKLDSNQIESCFKTLENLVSVKISEKLKAEIVEAIGLRKGHWFKCPNGHPYCIDRCGGAMELSRCPDCGKQIGGQNHSLTANNSLAPEMDGAQFPAYSEQANNLANFDLNRLY